MTEVILERSIVPTEIGQTHERLFLLARLGKAIEAERGAALSMVEKSDLFKDWHCAALRLAPFSLRKSASEYRLEFFGVYERARLPLGVDLLSEAWALAQSEPLPPEAKQFEDSKKCEALVALCYNLSRLAAGDGRFFLSSYQAANLLHVSPQHAHALLNGMVAVGIIALEKRGRPSAGKGRGKANRYRWTGYLEDSNS